MVKYLDNYIHLTGEQLNYLFDTNVYVPMFDYKLKYGKEPKIVNIKIDCSNCKASCCYICNLIPELVDFDDGTGRCIHLTKDHKCSIYDTRPFVCSNQKVYLRDYINIPEKEFIDITEKMCYTYKWILGEPVMKANFEIAKKLKEIKYKGILYQEHEYITKSRNKWKVHKNNLLCTIYYFINNEPKYIRYKSKKNNRTSSFNAIKLLIKTEMERNSE